MYDLIYTAMGAKHAKNDFHNLCARSSHAIPLLPDHLVITPERRGKILIDEVGFVTEAGTCADMGIKIMIKGRSSRILRQEFPHLNDWCGEHLRAPGCYNGQGWEVVEKYISSQNCTAGQEVYGQKTLSSSVPFKYGV